MGYQVNQTNASPTLDTLFQRIMARNRDAMALIDPVNKPRITGQPQMRLTYQQADRAISALASHFIEAGLPTHSVIAVQLPNTVEFMLTVLAANRAGLVVALFPLLWRQAELVAALNRTSARAIVTTSKIDGVIYADRLRLRRRPAGRHGLARPGDRPAIEHGAQHRPGWPQGGDHFLRRHQRGLSRRAAHAFERDRRRAGPVA